MSKLSGKASKVRQKQALVLLAIGIVVIILSIVSAKWLQPGLGNKRTVAERPKTKTIAIGPTSSDKESWRIHSDTEYSLLEERLRKLEGEVAERERQDRLQREREEEASKKKGNTPVAPPPVPSDGLFSQVATDAPPPPPVNTFQTPPPPASRARRIRSVNITGDVEESEEGQKSLHLKDAATQYGEETRKKRAGRSSGKDRYSDDEPLSYNRAGGRSADTYLPSGTFMRAVLLNGLDAPTGGQAQSNPHPVLLRVVDNAQLPNAFRANLKNCFITANGTGDLSAERAYIRLDRMSCIDDAGGAVDIAIKGYISGEDGKTGVRGRLVTKTGQVLANALLVGAMSGFGEAMRQSASTTSTSTLTGVQTSDVTNDVRYGLGTGIGKSLDRVAQYYMKLADKMYPVIEIDAGRVVDIVITRGANIERK